MKLTETQKKKAIEDIINDDIESCYKPRDRFNQYYYGIPAYKDMTDDEIIEHFEYKGCIELLESFKEEDLCNCWRNAGFHEKQDNCK